MSPPATIGIIAGSGPDAGIDLWQKILVHARAALGDSYGGDGDAPRVEIISEPLLGASMDLPASHDAVWPVLAETARELSERCDVYAIACNTLNVYAARINELDLPAELVSFADAVDHWAILEGIVEFGVLGARPVADLGEWSPYRDLADRLTIERPPNADDLHALIEEIKADGGTDPGAAERLAAIVAGFGSATVLLACTELPLVAEPVRGRRLVDVTDLAAAELVRRWSASPTRYGSR